MTHRINASTILYLLYSEYPTSDDKEYNKDDKKQKKECHLNLPQLVRRIHNAHGYQNAIPSSFSYDI
jgi:hypothetical protein